MAKNTSILLGDYFDKFINSQVHSGRYSSASKELKIGEKSGFNEDFDKNEFMKSLRLKYEKNEI